MDEALPAEGLDPEPPEQMGVGEDYIDYLLVGARSAREQVNAELHRYINRRAQLDGRIACLEDLKARCEAERERLDGADLP